MGLPDVMTPISEDMDPYLKPFFVNTHTHTLEPKNLLNDLNFRSFEETSCKTSILGDLLRSFKFEARFKAIYRGFSYNQTTSFGLTFANWSQPNCSHLFPSISDIASNKTVLGILGFQRPNLRRVSWLDPKKRPKRPTSPDQVFANKEDRKNGSKFHQQRLGTFFQRIKLDPPQTKMGPMESLNDPLLGFSYDSLKVP